jgi:hypothetical protein
MVLVASCGDASNASNAPKVSCTGNGDCVRQAGNLVAGDAAPSSLPCCAGGICLVPVPPSDCDSRYRYLTNAPAYGACCVNCLCGNIP